MSMILKILANSPLQWTSYKFGESLLLYFYKSFKASTAKMKFDSVLF